MRTLCTATSSYVSAVGTATHELQCFQDEVAAWDKKDFSSLTLTVKVSGNNVLAGYVQPNESYVQLVAYTASFDRRIEVALDDGPFSSTSVGLSDDLTAWTATLPTPDVGSHVIKARAVQGDQVSAVIIRSFTVVE